jgi:hypothetical protein
MSPVAKPTYNLDLTVILLSMKRQIKIIMEYDEEGIDVDQTSPLKKMRVYMDEQPIGCIQNFELSASADSFYPKLEITFPDFCDAEIDPLFDNHFAKDIDYYTQTLSQIPGVKIILQPLDQSKRVVALSEIGTNGYIELVPMKSRHNP